MMLLIVVDEVGMCYIFLYGNLLGNKEDKSQQSKKSTAETKSKPNGKHAKEDASKKKSKKKEKRKTREGDQSTEEGSGNLTPKPSEALQKRKLNDSSPVSVACVIHLFLLLSLISLSISDTRGWLW